MNRREFITLIGGLAIAWPLASFAQQPQQSLKRIGVLAVFGCPMLPGSFQRRLAELGWVEGHNFVFDCVSSIDRLDQLPALAHELVSRRPDVLMAIPVQFVSALKQETTTNPRSLAANTLGRRFCMAKFTISF